MSCLLIWAFKIDLGLSVPSFLLLCTVKHQKTTSSLHYFPNKELLHLHHSSICCVFIVVKSTNLFAQSLLSTFLDEPPTAATFPGMALHVVKWWPPLMTLQDLLFDIRGHSSYRQRNKEFTIIHKWMWATTKYTKTFQEFIVTGFKDFPSKEIFDVLTSQGVELYHFNYLKHVDFSILKYMWYLFHLEYIIKTITSIYNVSHNNWKTSGLELMMVQWNLKSSFQEF